VQGWGVWQEVAAYCVLVLFFGKELQHFIAPRLEYRGMKRPYPFYLRPAQPVPRYVKPAPPPQF